MLVPQLPLATKFSIREQPIIMGSKFSKRKGEAKSKKTRKEKKKKDTRNPRDPGSTQSLNIDHSVVSISPYPNNEDQYSKPEDTQSLSGISEYQSTEQDRTFVRPRTIPALPTPAPEKDCGTYIYFKSQTIYEDGQPPASQSKPPQLTEDVSEKESGYLIAKRKTEISTPPESDDESNYITPMRKTKTSTSTESETGTDFDLYDSIRSGNVRDRIKMKVKKKTDISDFLEADWKPTMRANVTSESNNESVISCEKGDLLQLIRDGEDNKSHFVKNLRTGEENFVLKTIVTKITNVDVKSLKCFFENFDRQAAEDKLMGSEIEIGTYLLRPSTAGCFALSLRCKNKRFGVEIRHYKIRANDKGEFYIDAASNSKTFSNIVELVSYYTENPGLRCNLKDPLPRDIPLSDFIVKFSDLELGEIIGSGHFGYVYAGIQRKNEQIQQVAVKSLKAEGSMTVEEFRKEAETMHKLRHKNLVSLLGICENKDQMYIITERMSRGSLLTLLRKDSGNTIKFNDLMDMAIQVVDGMCYLEKMAFVHRDLRADNVLIGDGNITKIADFGMARLIKSYYGHEKSFQDMPGSVFPYKWTAPEAIKQRRFTVKSDVWSFGILLYEIVTRGDEPYPAMTNHEALDWVEKGNRLRRPTKHHCPVTLYSIMKNCWLQNSSERPNFSDIKETLKEIMNLRR